jgi:hypothetical protein
MTEIEKMIGSDLEFIAYFCSPSMSDQYPWSGLLSIINLAHDVATELLYIRLMFR